MLKMINGWIRALYDWVFSLARHPKATYGLFGVSFIESSVFPIPPDVMLIPMVLARPLKWFFLASICLTGSLLGAYLGYYIGAGLFEAIGKPILAFYGKADAFTQLQGWYNESSWGAWAVLFAAITPFPFKVVTIFSGAVGLNLLTFTIVSIIGRGFRFYLVSWLLYKIGEPIREFIEKRLGLMFTIALVLLLGGFAAVRFLI